MGHRWGRGRWGAGLAAGFLSYAVPLAYIWGGDGIKTFTPDLWPLAHGAVFCQDSCTLVFSTICCGFIPLPGTLSNSLPLGLMPPPGASQLEHPLDVGALSAAPAP